MRLLTWFLSAASLCALGCGTVEAKFTPMPDAGVAVDAAVDAPDGEPPPPPPPPPPPGVARELTVVGGAVSDGRFQFQVEVTGGIAGGSARDATHRFDHALTVTLPQGAN